MVKDEELSMARAAVLCGEPIAPGFGTFVVGYGAGLAKVVSEIAHSCLPTAPNAVNKEDSNGDFFLLPAVFDARENDGQYFSVMLNVCEHLLQGLCRW